MDKKHKELESKLYTLLEKIAKQWGLGKPVGRVWAFLLFESKPLPQEKIEEGTHYSRGLISRSLKKLIDIGLVKYKKDKGIILYEANTSLIDGFKRLVIHFLDHEIEPFIVYLSEISNEIKDTKIKERIKNAILEYEKLKISVRIFSHKLDEVSSMDLEELKNIEKNFEMEKR